MTKKLQGEILQTTDKILELLGFRAEVRVNVLDEQILVEITTEPAGLLIGRQGQNLQAMERILQVAFHSEKSLADKIITVDVGGFRQKRQLQLAATTDSVIKEVLATGKAQTLTGLTAAERRTVHLKVGQNPNLLSESTGEGPNRVLIISVVLQKPDSDIKPKP